jgi:CheY-like chemotaxis protein
MGGEIGVKSTPGVGSKFWFTVPLRPALGPGYRPSKVAAGPHRRARILLAEDTPMNQELMVTLLKRAGHDVIVVGDGAAALEIVKQQSFDLILMDVQLPRRNGMEATRAIRALDGRMSKVPIVAMTARALSRDVDACIAAGMDDHLSKPIDTVALLAVIDHWARAPEPVRQPPPQQPPIQPPGAIDGGATEGGPAPKVHDEAVLIGLERHVGIEGAAKMIAMAHEDIPARLVHMERSLSDRGLVGREAHDLVAIAGNLGFNELAEQSRKLMTACASPEQPDITAAYGAVVSAAERAMAIIGELHRAAETRPLDAGAA